MSQDVERNEDLDLIRRAVGGDRIAIDKLLLSHHDTVLAYVQRLMPADLRSVISPEDVLQETFIYAYRKIESLTPLGQNSFVAWLRTIAKHRLADMAKAQRAVKRGGRVKRVQHGSLSTSIAFVEKIAGQDKTPSSLVGRKEIGSLLRVQVAGLKTEYREALHQRYVEGRPVAEIAARMKRSPGAVQMLCRRGMEKLKAALGRSSRYFRRR
jgi:RNA polymerase sigma-70 factor (ECF subfamily)